jgi:hypothetical protein
MPTWAWCATAAACLVVGAIGGFGFAAWLIGMNVNEHRPASGANLPQPPPPA